LYFEYIARCESKILRRERILKIKAADDLRAFGKAKSRINFMNIWIKGTNILPDDQFEIIEIERIKENRETIKLDLSKYK